MTFTGGMGFLADYFAVTRPLSLVLAVIATLVTAAVVHHGDRSVFTSAPFLQALGMAVSIQLAANLTNTYYDYKNGFDTVDRRQLNYRLDRNLANGVVGEQTVFYSMVIYYLIGISCIIPQLISTSNPRMLIMFITGISLAFCYTGGPGLKYKALGDILIFICFGPLLMQFQSLMLTNELNNELFLYCVPIGLLAGEVDALLIAVLDRA